MLSEEFIKKEKRLHLSDDVLNLSVIKTTLGCWNGTFSKNETFLLYVVNNNHQKVLHINLYIRLQDIVFSSLPSPQPPKKKEKIEKEVFLR